jgi:hypothetical protein
MPRRARTYGSGDDWIAALAGGLTGLSRGMGDIEADRLRREEADAQEARRQEELALRKQEIEARFAKDAADLTRQQATDRRLDQAEARTDLADMRTQFGAGTDLPEDSATIARTLAERAGRPAALAANIQPTGEVGFSSGMGPVAGLPAIRSALQFRTTEPERQKADAERRRTAAVAAAPEHLRQPLALSEATGQRISPADMVAPLTPQQKAEQETQAAVARETALMPVRLKQRSGEAAIDAANRPTGPKPVTDTAAMSATMRLNQQYQTNTKAQREVMRYYSMMGPALERVRKGEGKGTAEQAIVQSFNKILDPESVVREGEYDRTAQGQAIIERMRAISQSIQQGGSVSITTLEQMAALSKTYADQAAAYNTAEKARVTKFATSYGLDPTHIFGEEPAASPAAPTTGGKPKFELVP